MTTKTSRTTVLLCFLAAMLFISCTEQHAVQQSKPTDSLITAAYKIHDYDSILSLVDLHQQDGTLSMLKSCYWRGYAYSRQRLMRKAEMEWKNAVAQNIDNDEDMVYYAQSANRLTGLLYLKGDYGEAIHVALPAIKLLKEKEYTLTNDFTNLLTFIGSCQLKLDHLNESSKSFAQAWEQYEQITQADPNHDSYTNAIVGIVTIVDAYIQTAHYREALEWTVRLDHLLKLSRQCLNMDEAYVDKQWGRLCLYRACALEGMGDKAEARKAYNASLTSQYAKTNEGKLEATNYLMAAHRWSEAADNFQVMDAQVATYGARMTLENIHSYLMQKFLANAEAQRTDSAIAVGKQIYLALDSAIIWQKQDDATELATIYEIQKKETELSEQRATVSDQRLLIIITPMVLALLFFGIFIYFRQRSASRLIAAYHDLEYANARAEESSRMKSDFIHQISHEIRTPLNILSGYTQILTTPDMTYDEATLSDIKHQITENTDRIANLVNKMLELSDAKNKGVIECSDRVTAVQIAVEAINASGITEAGHLTFDMMVSPDAENTTIQTNLQAAVRALSLVLDNARKFTAPPEARQQEKLTDHQQKVVLRTTVSSGRLFFSVEDTGIGIPHKEAERIFEEFVQLDEYYDGTGIGLTVARSLARRIGGDIMLDTAYIGGSRFVMTLPINEMITDELPQVMFHLSRKADVLHRNHK